MSADEHKDQPGVPDGQLMDHEYDGIQEYDNPMPGWWKALFWATFVFSVVYIMIYHIRLPGDPVNAEYRAEVSAFAAVQEAEAAKNPVSEEALAALLKDEGALSGGKAVFVEKCSPCHGAKGEGVIGPNLTDNAWLHGGKLMDINAVVTNGVAEKGMIAWGKTLSPADLRKVVAFVGSIRNTNVPGKAPQGEAAK